MYIEKLPNGKYRVGERFKDPITGKSTKVSITVGSTKKSVIKAAQIALQDKMNARTASRGKGCTLRVLADKYIADLQISVRESTAKRNEYFANYACDILGKDSLVDNLNAGYVREKLNATKKDASGKNEFLKRYKAFIRWGYSNDYVNNVAYLDKLQPYKDDEKKERVNEKFLESEELNKLINEMKIPLWKKLSEFLYLTGMRIGEAMCLTATDIDLKNREIRVNKTWVLTTDKVSSMTKTDAGTRDVYIQDQLLPLCTDLRKKALENKLSKGCDLVFQKDGKRIVYGSYTKYLRGLSERVLDRKITPHVLRHTHVSLLAAQGLTLEEIGRRVGHAEDSDVTRRVYFHVTKGLKQRDYERIKNIRIG